MPIEFNCPHCATPYKLKDELAGKKATCRNPDCRQVITVPAPKATVPPTPAAPPKPAAAPKAAPKPAAKPPARKDETPLPPPIDAEAAAAAALADAPKDAAAADAPIPVECAFCNHKWTEPRDKAGKNVLCPNEDCRQRNKVPVPKDDKPKNWREADTGPSLRKENFEKPTDVVTSGDAAYVKGKVLEEAGALDHLYEPVPLKRKLFFATLILVPLLGLGFGVYKIVTGWGERKQEQYFEAAFKQLSVEGLPGGEGDLFAAVLHLAAGEFKFGDPAEGEFKLKKAHEHFTKAREEMRQAAQKDDPKKKDAALPRYALGAELALAQLALGGTDDEVKAQTRFRWVPDTATGRQMKVKGTTHDVFTELRQTLQEILPADFDHRLGVARRLTRELVKRGRTDIAGMLPTLLFGAPEQPEAKAAVALEVYRIDKANPFPAQVADELKGVLAKGVQPGMTPVPASAVVLWKALNTEKAPQVVNVALPGVGQTVSDGTRTAAVGLLLLDNKADEAAEVVRRPGQLPSQLRAAVQIAEWVPENTTALDAALAIAQKAADPKKKPEPSALPPAPLLLRLAQLAGERGKPELAKSFAELIPDESARAWAKADGLRLAASPTAPLDESAFDAPDDNAKVKAGHGWGRFWVARHNTRVTGDQGKMATAVKKWPNGTIVPMGLAGVALGRRDH